MDDKEVGGSKQFLFALFLALLIPIVLVLFAWVIGTELGKLSIYFY